MASSPLASPSGMLQRSLSARFEAQRSSSRMSIGSKPGEGSRASDEDSKTSVKVAVRVRPPLKSTDPGFELIPQRFQRSMLHVISPTGLAVDSPQGRKIFDFDRVFGEDINQEGVWEYLNESVNAFVQGYNVSVLAYGQSGSGKSYTMGTSGPAEQNDPQIKGVLPRAATVLFENLNGSPSMKRNGSSSLRTPTRYSTSFAQALPTLASLARSNEEKSWQLKATYVEIYNEQLRDLLVPESVPQSERATVLIREDIKGRILLTGLHQVNISSIDDLLGALNFGSSIRQTDATAINAKSSRSHAVFSLNLAQRKNRASSTTTQEKRFSVPVEAMSGSENWVTVESKLHFVDLAGSERLKNTGASGDRAKEGISINAGLASLGKVISQLSSLRHPGSHVSYRDSKLTRVLQDSLGGNAITYMIACVTPAEFHLSETLNTVQYAQHAKAIQSKPRIHQVSDDSDKQAVIDRLRAEVSFLRDQIRNSDRGDRRVDTTQERAERQSEHEIELQNHLLDIQENYTALSQRHTKLISEITRARDDEASETPTLTETIGDSAVERLKRSNSFAEAVEQVVLEYEKTIQSLETSLSKTRSSLATTESSLLERETKCAYIETVNQELETRVQKMLDRESIREKYLRGLESKIDGQSSGEEKNSTVVIELRKENARIQQSEASCEEYISTLEERLAEKDQDMDLMQREVDRLEHVVERQRSLGKLDNLLYEFDHIPKSSTQQDQNSSSKPLTNGIAKAGTASKKTESRFDAVLNEAMSVAIPDSEDGDWEHVTSNPESHKANPADNLNTRNEFPLQSVTTPELDATLIQDFRQSPAQSKFMADKLEIVTQELFDLKVEHESTVNEYDLMSAKYEEALRTLAELQDAVDEARHPVPIQTFSTPASTRPTSFLGDARVNELKDGGNLPSSRSLSSELSLAGGSTSLLEQPAAEMHHQKIVPRTSGSTFEDEELLQEIEDLKSAQQQKDLGMATLINQYMQLQESHQETLDIVEELKAEVQKAKLMNPTSTAAPVLRRKASQNVMTIDRAHRSLASLRNIAAENFEDKPDTMQNFELNLNTAMHELHQRSERVQVLEAELSSVKKEMEGKMTMISGLARERSSLKSSSPMDISVVSSMHNQLLEAENQMRTIQADHINREQELVHEIDTLKKSMNSQSTKSVMPGFFPETPAASINEPDDKQLGETSVQPYDITKLQDELAMWQNKHKAVVDSMHVSEQNFKSTIRNLEAAMASVEAVHAQKSSQFEDNAEDNSLLEKARISYEEELSKLRGELDEHKGMLSSHVSNIAQLEQSHLAARQEIEEATVYKNTTQSSLDLHRNQISMLEKQLEEHSTAIEFHKNGLKSLHDGHVEALEDMRSTTQAEAKMLMDSQLQEHRDEMEIQYREREKMILSSIELANGRLKGLIVSQDQFQAEGQSLEVQSSLLKELISRVESEAHDAQEEKASANRRISELEAMVADLKTSHQQNVADLQKVTEEKDTVRRIVDELEDQLSSIYDQHRDTSSRLSVLTSNRDQALLDANMQKAKLEEELENHRVRVAQLESQYGGGSSYVNGTHTRERSDSLNSNLRKSASIASLPSPPPAIPLPPLPTNVPAMSSPPMTNGAIPLPIKDESISAQYVEDQEARIRTIEKHLFAEKQLTATLEEALVDLETQGNKVRADMEAWKKKAWSYEDEIASLRKERNSTRYSVQAVEEERHARKEAEAAREHLEERMAAINKKKKKSGFNCF